MINKTDWNLFASNEEAWSSILTDCAKAEKNISLEQFVFSKDDFGQKLIDVCAERATKGVRVRFLWDAAGSFTFWGSNIAQELKEKNIELLFWRTLIPTIFKVQNFRSWYLRNHRRTLVIDEKIGYTGSICINDQMKNWRDTNIRMEGSVVNSMQNEFDYMWTRAKGQKVSIIKPTHKNAEFKYETNYPSPGNRHLYRSLVEAIRNSRKYIYITTPYFVPTHRLLRVIKLAAHRGVDVKILIPERTNHFPTLDIAARSYFNTLLESGVQIYLYGNNLIHSKSIVVDGEWSSVGSLNLDNASLLYNFEANISTTNSRFAEELSAHFVRDLQNSKQVDFKNWKNRFFIEKIPEIMIRLVSRFL